MASTTTPEYKISSVAESHVTNESSIVKHSQEVGKPHSDGDTSSFVSSSSEILEDNEISSDISDDITGLPLSEFNQIQSQDDPMIEFVDDTDDSSDSYDSEDDESGKSADEATDEAGEGSRDISEEELEEESGEESEEESGEEDFEEVSDKSGEPLASKAFQGNAKKETQRHGSQSIYGPYNAIDMCEFCLGRHWTRDCLHKNDPKVPVAKWIDKPDHSSTAPTPKPLQSFAFSQVNKPINESSGANTTSDVMVHMIRAGSFNDKITKYRAANPYVFLRLPNGMNPYRIPTDYMVNNLLDVIPTGLEAAYPYNDFGWLLKLKTSEQAVKTAYKTMDFRWPETDSGIIYSLFLRPFFVKGIRVYLVDQTVLIHPQALAAGIANAVPNNRFWIGRHMYKDVAGGACLIIFERPPRMQLFRVLFGEGMRRGFRAVNYIEGMACCLCDAIHHPAVCDSLHPLPRLEARDYILWRRPEV